MKSVLLGLMSLVISSSAFAAKYQCNGFDSSQKNPIKASLEISIQAKSIDIVDNEGGEYSIERMPNKNPAATRVTFADYGYDGYGGYVEITVPKSVANASTTVTQPFIVFYTLEVYSESGNVGGIKVKATCQPAKI